MAQAAVERPAVSQSIPWNVARDAPYIPTARQYEFHSAPEEIKLYGGAVGGAKTTALVCEALTLLWQIPHNEGVIARRDFDDLRRTTYAEFLRWCPPDLIEQHHKSEHWIRLRCSIHAQGDSACPGGSLVHFLDAKDTAALKNSNLGFVCFDQAEEISYDAFIWARTRIRRRFAYTPLLLSANPGPGWVKSLFIDKMRPSIDDEPETPLECCQGPVCRQGIHKFVPALPRDNPHLPAGYVEAQLANMPPAYAQMLIEGRWDVTLNSIYTMLDRQLHLREIPKGLEMRPFAGAIGVDYGRGHLSAIVAVTVDVHGRRWVRETWAKNGGDIHEISREVFRMCQKYDINRGRTDPQEGVLAQVLSGSEDRKGQKYNFSRSEIRAGSREARIGLLATALMPRPGTPVHLVNVARGQAEFHGPFTESEMQPGLLIDAYGPGNRELWVELLGYHYERTNQGTLRTPSPDRTDDDRVAALEDAMEELERPHNVPVARQSRSYTVAW